MSITYLDDTPQPSSGKGLTYLDDETPWSQVPGNALENAKRIATGLPATAEAIGKGALALGSLPADAVQYPFQKMMGVKDTSLSQDAGTIGSMAAGGAKGIANEVMKYRRPIEQFKQNPIDTLIDVGSVAAPLLAPEAETLQAGVGETALRAQRLAQEQSIKSLEGAVGQVRQVGPEAARELGQMALDKGIVSPFTPTTLGMERKLGSALGEAGGGIGAARQAGDIAGGAPAADDLKSAIEGQLANKYGSGMRSGESGSLGKALSEVGKIGQPEVGIGPAEGPSFVNNAAKATEMNQFASGNKMLQPTGAFTDVANTLSKLNNEGLQKALSPEQWQAYQQSLNDYSSLSDIQKFFSRGEARELAGRGSGLLTDVYKGAKDVIGHKALAAGADTFAKMLSSPAVAKNLPALTTAAKVGPGALETTHYLLQKNDPGYAKATEGAKSQAPAEEAQDPQTIMGHALSDPDMAKWRPTFQAAAERGPQAIIANHFTLMQRDPDYNATYLHHYSFPNR